MLFHRLITVIVISGAGAITFQLFLIHSLLNLLAFLFLTK